LPDFFTFTYAVNNLEILVGADGFDSKKHWECLALHPESKDPVFKQ